MQIDRPIVIALTLFIILLLVFFLVFPEYDKFKSLQTDLGGKIAEVNAQKEYYVEIDKIYSELQRHQDDIKKIDEALPNEPALGKLIYSLQKTAQINGLIVKDLFLSKSSANTNTTSNNSSIKNLIFSMDITGSYSSMENFLISLEKSSRIFEVTNISFGAGTNNYNLQIKTHTY